jgi:hypothetical protein
MSHQDIEVPCHTRLLIDRLRITMLLIINRQYDREVGGRPASYTLGRFLSPTLGVRAL